MPFLSVSVDKPRNDSFVKVIEMFNLTILMVYFFGILF